FLFLPLASVPAAIGIGLLLRVPYRYSFSSPQKTTVIEQMRDPYASPVRGKAIQLEGKVIGRGVPGYIFGEDMMYQDPTGLIFLNYTSLFSFIGNLFFALKKIKTLFEAPSTASGWFFRGLGSSVVLSKLETKKETVKSYPLVWSAIFPVILIAVSIVLGLQLINF
ncbi:MAG TPA: hypothetical protein VLK33_02960, partial [Terriglobales bacterium]|nr:hypothetical protein [Terriglobales bacterium]